MGRSTATSQQSNTSVSSSPVKQLQQTPFFKPQQCQQSEPLEQFGAVSTAAEKLLCLQRLPVQDRLPHRPKEVCLNFRAFGCLCLQLGCQENKTNNPGKKDENEETMSNTHTPQKKSTFLLFFCLFFPKDHSLRQRL